MKRFQAKWGPVFRFEIAKKNNQRFQAKWGPDFRFEIAGDV